MTPAELIEDAWAADRVESHIRATLRHHRRGRRLLKLQQHHRQLTNTPEDR